VYKIRAACRPSPNSPVRGLHARTQPPQETSSGHDARRL
jgi:hypothetical protein